jgi:hypothetical protein
MSNARFTQAALCLSALALTAGSVCAADAPAAEPPPPYTLIGHIDLVSR